MYELGRLSLLEFAAAMEHFGKLGAVVDADDDDDTQSTTDRTQRPVPSLVLLTPETAEFNSQPQPGSSQQMVSEEENTKLKGEFFRSGDEPATFSIRKRRKMPPTIKNLMGEAHVRFAKGDLNGAEIVCMEVIKERNTFTNYVASSYIVWLQRLLNEKLIIVNFLQKKIRTNVQRSFSHSCNDL